VIAWLVRYVDVIIRILTSKFLCALDIRYAYGSFMLSEVKYTGNRLNENKTNKTKQNIKKAQKKPHKSLNDVIFEPS